MRPPRGQVPGQGTNGSRTSSATRSCTITGDAFGADIGSHPSAKFSGTVVVEFGVGVKPFAWCQSP